MSEYVLTDEDLKQLQDGPAAAKPAAPSPMDEADAALGGGSPPTHEQQKQHNLLLQDMFDNPKVTEREIADYIKANKITVTPSEYERALAWRRKGGKGVKFIVDGAAPPKDAALPENFNGDTDANAAGYSLANGLLFGMVPRLDAFGQAIAGDGDPNTGFWDTYDQKLGESRAIRDHYRTTSPILSMTGEVVGGLGTVAFGGPVSLGKMILQGGGYGAAYGAGNSDADYGTLDGVIKGAKEAGFGAAVGAGATGVLAGGSSALSRFLKPREVPGQNVLDAAGRLNRDGTATPLNGPDRISPLPVHVAGDTTKKATRFTEASVVGGGKVADGLSAFENATTGAIRRTADDMVDGPRNARSVEETANAAVDKEVPGSLANFADETEQLSDVLYKRVNDTMSGVPLQAKETIDFLTKEIEGLKSDAGKIPGLANLIATRDDLLTKPQTLDSLRRLRKTWRSRWKPEESGIANLDVASAISRDMRAGVQATGGKRALQDFDTADLYYSERMDLLKNVINPILNAGSPEKVTRYILGLSRSDSTKMAKVLDLLPKQQSQELRASILENMGLARAHQQGLGDAPGGQTFSLESFLTNWRNMGDTLKDTIFGGAATQTRKDIDDLVTLSTAWRKAQRGGRRGAMDALAVGTGFIGATAAGSMGMAPLALIVPMLSGRLLSSPGVARALVKMKTQPLAYVTRRLTEAASRSASPAVAAEITGLRDALLGARNAPSVEALTSLDELESSIPQIGGGEEEFAPAETAVPPEALEEMVLSEDDLKNLTDAPQ